MIKKEFKITLEMTSTLKQLEISKIQKILNSLTILKIVDKITTQKI